MKSHWFTALLLLTFIVLNGPVSANEGSIAFTGATIIDGTAAQDIANTRLIHSVWIAGNRVPR